MEGERIGHHRWRIVASVHDHDWIPPRDVSRGDQSRGVEDPRIV